MTISFIVSDLTLAEDAIPSQIAQKPASSSLKSGGTSASFPTAFDKKMQDAPASNGMEPVISTEFQANDTASKVKDIHALQFNYSLRAADLQSATSAITPAPNQVSLQRMRETPIAETFVQKPETSESPPPDKRRYNLFNPTPRRFWREFSTDRPDKTETPFTVDAGNYTMEADLLVYTRDTNSPDGTRTESFNIFVPNFKVGLTNNIDLQLIPEVYNIVRTKPRNGKREEVSGFGDFTVRMKVNFWGNDGGKTAFGVLPFIKFPTNQNNLGNNSIEGGVIFPFAVTLSDRWDVGMQTEFDLNKNADKAGYNAGFVNTVSFG